VRINFASTDPENAVERTKVDQCCNEQNGANNSKYSLKKTIMDNTQVHRPIITVQQHILEEQKRFPGASGEFSWLLSGITLATKTFVSAFPGDNDMSSKVLRDLIENVGEEDLIVTFLKSNRHRSTFRRLVSILFMEDTK